MADENNLVLSDDEEIKLIQKAQKGDIKSWEKLLSANKGHIDEFSNKFLGCGLSKEKIVQYGTVGFIIAIAKFKADTNSSLLSYANLWIEKIIHNAIYIYKSDYDISVAKYSGVIPKFTIGSKNIIISKSDDSEGERLVDIIGGKFFITKAELEQMELEAKLKEEADEIEYEIRSAIYYTQEHDDYLKKSFKNVSKAINKARENQRREEIKKLELLQNEKENQILNGIWAGN